MLSIVNLETGDLACSFWVSYAEIVKLAPRCACSYPNSSEDDYKINPEALEDAITDKTRMVIYSSPCNPSGSVYTLEETQALADV